MQVTLLDYTGIGNSEKDHAINLLIFTKSTRLQMSPTLLDDIANWPLEKKMEELNYMANTIPSSWEYVDYTFMIEGVTRAFTHQLVRTRTASFAQQTMRVLNVSDGPGWAYLTGPSIIGNADINKQALYSATMSIIDNSYKELIANGATIEDARGLLPTNILTNIVMKINMRNFVELVQKRSSSRVQGEYRDVLQAMKEAVLAAHPWVSVFLDRTFDRAVTDLEAAINSFDPEQIMMQGGNMDYEVDESKMKKWKTDLVKLLDQIRAKQ
jgi:flavin-dependent thymidylate synthase